MKVVKKSKKIKKLPASFRPLFWSYCFGDLDANDDKRLIIKHIMLYGSLAQWQWMIQRYGAREIRNVISRLPASELRPSAIELARTVFDIKKISHVRRVPHA